MSLKQTLHAYGSGVMTSLVPMGADETPAAYLNYIFVDQEYKNPVVGFTRVSKAADGSWETLKSTFKATEAGHLFVYVSNESQEDINVYFDDFTIMCHSEVHVLQMEDYYPYGLPIEPLSYKIEGMTYPNRFLYQQKQWITEENAPLDLYDFHARLYDPALGRFLGVDPQNQFASPYTGMGNNPVMGVDPDGEFVFSFALKKLSLSFIRGVVDAIDQGDVGRMDPTLRGTATNNHFEITAGLFRTDSDKNPNDRALQFIKRHTFQALNTGLGYRIAVASNTFQDVERVERFHGATVLYRNTREGGNDGMSVGGFIHLRSRDRDGNLRTPGYHDAVLLHEYGHYLQEQAYGPMAIGMGANSLLSTLGGNNNPFRTTNLHQENWFEQDANWRVVDYFSEKAAFNTFRLGNNRTALENFTREFPNQRRSRSRWFWYLPPFTRGHVFYTAFINSGL